MSFVSFAVAFLLLLGHLNLCDGAPHAIVHIGPHKTSSTHIQTTLYSLHKNMAREGYYWPEHPNHVAFGVKQLSGYGFSFKFGRSLNHPVILQDLADLETFFNSSLIQKRNIIMSSEEFNDMDISRMETMKRHLSGFNVTIVFVYRELLSQMISLHNQLFKPDRVPGKSKVFSTYLFSILDKLPLMLDALQILHRYASVFGAENIRIIDLNGVVAKKKDVAQVLVCDIAGILCDKDHLFNANKTENHGYSLVPGEVFTQMTLLIAQNNTGYCKLCGDEKSEYKQFAARYNNVTLPRPVVPVIASNLTLLVPLATQIDTELRKKYSSIILYNDVQASLDDMNNVHISELDVEQFVGNVRLMKWLRAEIELLRSEERLCKSLQNVPTGLELIPCKCKVSARQAVLPPPRIISEPPASTNDDD